jgi:hypothetical protein
MNQAAPPIDPAVDDAAAVAETALKERLVARLTADFVLRSLNLAAAEHAGDMTRAVILTAIVSANTAHLNMGRGRDARYQAMHELPPDEERRPVSVSAIAASLGLPFETARRHIKALIAAGHCARVKGGIVCPAAAVGREANSQAIVANAANVRRYLRELKAAGVLRHD